MSGLILLGGGDAAVALDMFREATGQEPYVRDLGLLIQSLHRPHTSWGGHEVYSDLHSKMAALLDGVNRNHPLVDGNKRLSWILVRATYGMNGYRCIPYEDQAYDIVMASAKGSRTIDELTDILSEAFVSD